MSTVDGSRNDFIPARRWPSLCPVAATTLPPPSPWRISGGCVLSSNGPVFAENNSIILPTGNTLSKGSSGMVSSGCRGVVDATEVPHSFSLSRSRATADDEMSPRPPPEISRAGDRQIDSPRVTIRSLKSAASSRRN